MTSLEFPPLEPAEILAAEEALLDSAETGLCGETLSFWESPQHFVVLGYGNKVATEVNQPTCARLNIPILRRCSGGGTVLQGPGVMNYSLVLQIAEGTPLTTIHGANQFIMQRNADALTKLLNSRPENRNQKFQVEVQGHTDLAIDGLKFSGNAQRRKRTHLLFHGAILLKLDLDLLDKVLPMPTLQPDYRHGRSHKDFLMQLGVPAESVKSGLREAWKAEEESQLVAQLRGGVSMAKLMAEKYSRADWNLRV